MFPGGPDGAGPLAPSRGDLIHNSGKTRAEALKTQSTPQPSSPAWGAARASQLNLKPVQAPSRWNLSRRPRSILLAQCLPKSGTDWERKFCLSCAQEKSSGLVSKFSVQFRSDCANSVAAELRQVPDDLGLGDQVHIDRR